MLVLCLCSAARSWAGHNQAIGFSRRLSLWVVTTISIRFLVTLASVLVTMAIHVHMLRCEFGSATEGRFFAVFFSRFSLEAAHQTHSAVC